MRRMILLVTAVVSRAVVAQAPDSAAVAAAITAGAQADRCESVGGVGRVKTAMIALGLGFEVSVFGPLNDVQCRSTLAKKKYKTVTLSQMMENAAANLLTVTADPQPPVLRRVGWDHVPLPTHLVLLPGEGEDPSAAIQPDSVRIEPVEWGNAAGGKFEGRRITAYFPMRALPPGKFLVAIVTDTQEYQWTVHEKDRRKIR